MTSPLSHTNNDPAMTVIYPSGKAVFWVSLLAGPFGFIPADRAAKRAHAVGLPQTRFWILWVLMWMFSAAFYALVGSLVALAAGVALFGAAANNDSGTTTSDTSSSTYATQADCENAGGTWYDGTCYTD